MKSLKTYLNTAGLFGAVFLASLVSSCGTIKDDLSDCPVYLEFIYDYNMEYADAFDPQVPAVDVYIFDSEGRYLFTRHAQRTALDRGNRMRLGNDIPSGQYQVFTVGGLSDNFRVTGKNGSPLVAGETRIEEIRTALVRASATVSAEFPDFWVGEPVTVDHHGKGSSVWPVPLMKYTNRFYIQLASADTERPDRASFADTEIPADARAAAAYTFEIETPEGAVYGPDHTPLSNERVTYTPYWLAPGTGSVITDARINTVRLLDRKGYLFTVRNSLDGSVLWQYDLIALLAYSKPAARPDGTALPLQEYLDRESNWQIVVLYDTPGGPSVGYVAVGIKVNDWIIWFNEIGWP